MSQLVWGVGNIEQENVSAHIGRLYTDTGTHVYTQEHTSETEKTVYETGGEPPLLHPHQIFSVTQLSIGPQS